MSRFDYRKIPGKRVAAGLMLLAEDDRFVMVCPSYRPEWLLPGGIVEAGESPLACCCREVKEELGLIVADAVLAGVSWKPARAGGTEALHFVFYARRPARELEQLRPRDAELRTLALVSLDEALEKAGPVQGRRLAACHAALRQGRTAYIDLTD